MNKKRGQVTVFIIVGIILLIISSLFLYFREQAIPLAVQEKIPSEFVPVRNFIEECMQIHAKEGLYIIGLQGGYALLPENIERIPDSYVPMDKRGYIKVPYWYYKEQNRVPSFDDMKKNLELHMNENLRFCLNDFIDFEKKFTVEEMTSITTEVVVTDNEIIFTTNYPIKVKELGTDKSVTFSVFRATLPVKLREMYELATDAMSTENANMFFEDLTMDLMTLGPEVPFSDIKFQCNQVRWLKSDIEERVKNLLFYNLPRIKIENTDYTPYPKDAMYNYSIHHFLWNVGENEYKDLRAGVLYYKYWPMVFRVRPSQGNVMRASYGKGPAEFLLDFICLNVYKFTYDVEYPVQVMIFDDNAFLGEGYSFRFAFPVLIRSNEGDRRDIQVGLYEAPPDQGMDPCEEVSPANFMIYAKDNNTDEDLKDVNVTFVCANVYECYLGATNPVGNFYGLEANLPVFCSPGRIKVEAEGYSPIVEELPVDTRIEPSSTVKLTPIKEFKFDVKRVRVTSGVPMGEVKIQGGQKVLIVLTTDKLHEFTQMRSFPFVESPEDDKTPDSYRTIPLALKEITYRLDIMLISADDTIVGGWRGNFTPTMDELVNNDFIGFRVLEIIPNPKTMMQQAKMVTYLEEGAYVNETEHIFSIGGDEPEPVLEEEPEEEEEEYASRETMTTLELRCEDNEGKLEPACTGKFAADVENIQLCYQAGEKTPWDTHSCIMEYASKTGNPDDCEESLNVGDAGLFTAQEMVDKCKEIAG